LGRATRLSRYVTDLDKAYTTTARFGAVSDTLDADGRITPLKNTLMPIEAALHTATKSFTGNIRQTPPMASAIKVKGKRLYKAHRRGEVVERESRSVIVHAFDLLSLDEEDATAAFAVSCSSGTYVRTLVSDLANSLNTGAYLIALRRARVGHMKVEDATPLQDLDSKTVRRRIIQSEEVVKHLPVVSVPPAVGRRLVCTGRPLAAFGLSGSYRVRSEGELLAIYRDVGEDISRAEVVLCGG
jgi:tRNA pseudouridine55 synthase